AELVRDRDVTNMRGQCPKTRPQLASLGGRRAGRRLLEQDQSGRAGKSHADRELPLLAVRQVRDRAPSDRLQSHLLEQLVGGEPRGMRRSWTAEVETPARHAAYSEEEIVPDRQVAEQQ